MAKSVKLLLLENVEALGIVGDVVNVRLGYARNFLLPRNLATQPSEEKIKALASKRAEAEKQLAELRRQRTELAGKLQGVEITLIRSCNDQGVLYGSISQQDIATALNALGHGVKPRDVRISQVMKRVDKYDVHVKLDSDLDSVIKLTVQADQVVTGCAVTVAQHHHRPRTVQQSHRAECIDARFSGSVSPTLPTSVPQVMEGIPRTAVMKVSACVTFSTSPPHTDITRGRS